MDRVDKRQACNSTTCSTYNCSQRNPLNTEINANSSGSLLGIITPFPTFSCHCRTPHRSLCFPALVYLRPSFACFAEFPTPANPSIFFSHIRTYGSADIVSRRAPVSINKIWAGLGVLVSLALLDSIPFRKSRESMPPHTKVLQGQLPVP